MSCTFGHLRRPNPQRRQTGRPPRRAAHQVRAGDQPQDRQGPRPHDPAGGAGAGGRGDPMMDRRAFIAGAVGLLAAPLAAEAQQAGKVYRVGFLRAGEPPSRSSASARAARAGLCRGPEPGHRVRYRRQARSAAAARRGAGATEGRRHRGFGRRPARGSQQATTTMPIVLASRRPGRARAWSRAWHDPAATSPGLPIIDADYRQAPGAPPGDRPELTRVAVLHDLGSLGNGPVQQGDARTRHAP